MKTHTPREIRTLPTRPQFEIICSRQQINLYLSGQGGGKTHCAGIVSGQLIAAFPKAHGFIGANTYTQLSDSTLYRIRKVWKEIFGWSEYSRENPKGDYVVDVQPPSHFNTAGHEYDSYHGKICFKAGTVIYKGSLENYKAHDGKEFSWALLDETKDTKEIAVKEVIIGRLREQGMYVDKRGKLVTVAQNKDTKEVHSPFNPLYIFTSPAKVDWINEWFNLDTYQDEITSLIYSAETFFKKVVDNKFVVISSAYHNAANLPDGWIEQQKKNLHTVLQNTLIYGDPFSQSGGEFYKMFSRSKHVWDITKFPAAFQDNGRVYNKLLPLHISFDFNVNPYMTATIWQMDGRKLYQINELCLKSPLNTTAAVCRQFCYLYPNHEAGLFVYGDPSGKKEDTRSEKGFNDFRIIMAELAKYRPQQRVLSKAPPVVMRGNFINTIFESNYKGIEIIVCQNCGHSINDLLFLKEASDGTKKKEKEIDENTKVSQEKWGHTSDSMDYLICFAFASDFENYQRGGTSAKITTGPNISKHGY